MTIWLVISLWMQLYPLRMGHSGQITYEILGPFCWHITKHMDRWVHGYLSQTQAQHISFYLVIPGGRSGRWQLLTEVFTLTTVVSLAIMPLVQFGVPFMPLYFGLGSMWKAYQTFSIRWTMLSHLNLMWCLSFTPHMTIGTLRNKSLGGSLQSLGYGSVWTCWL